MGCGIYYFIVLNLVLQHVLQTFNKYQCMGGCVGLLVSAHCPKWSSAQYSKCVLLINAANLS